VWIQLDDYAVICLELPANVVVDKVIGKAYAEYGLPRCNAKASHKGIDLVPYDSAPNTSGTSPIVIQPIIQDVLKPKFGMYSSLW